MTTTANRMITTEQVSDLTERIRSKLRALIDSTGRSYKSISDEAGIPYATLLRRMKQPGAVIYIDDVAAIADVCELKPGELAELFA